jgi:hypothetical protein
MIKVKMRKLVRVGEAKRLTKGGLGAYPELLVGMQMTPQA